LMAELAGGRQEALGALYSRYGGAIFSIAQHSLDRGAAEELVQDVFLTAWRGAATFDAEQGSFRSWLFRLAHWRILNELRRQRRRPRTVAGSDVDQDDELELPSDRLAGPEERALQNERGQVVQSALAALPLAQRQAIMLAFLEDLTHEQVARQLEVPLGTAKTRIRSGI